MGLPREGAMSNHSLTHPHTPTSGRGSPLGSGQSCQNWGAAAPVGCWARGQCGDKGQPRPQPISLTAPICHPQARSPSLQFLFPFHRGPMRGAKAELKHRQGEVCPSPAEGGWSQCCRPPRPLGTLGEPPGSLRDCWAPVNSSSVVPVTPGSSASRQGTLSPSRHNWGW